GHRSCLDDDQLGPRHLVEELHQGRDSGDTAISLYHLTGRTQHGNLAEVAMHIDTDIMGTLHRGLHAFGFRRSQHRQITKRPTWAPRLLYLQWSRLSHL